jgi:indoleamine 2,3-dioxygenase
MTVQSKLSFTVLTDPRPHDNSLNAFMVSTTRGFLPRADPIDVLPPDFAVLESLICRMPVRKLDGSPGLLADGQFGQAVLDELPDLTAAIEKHQDNLPLMNALYRDYSFLVSAYLLEPCKLHLCLETIRPNVKTGHDRYLQGLDYGLGRSKLPRNIAVPMLKVAEM